jgi:SAM-dependent methyltransferase
MVMHAQLSLSDILNRKIPPEPWAEGEKIPWNDPGFSERMLEEHFSQDHNEASRRSVIIDRHVAWIHHDLLAEKPAKILDLGCGPGFYTSRLAALCHECRGIDFSPASIAYARREAERAGETCEYLEQDVRAADYDEEYGLVMMIYGEINVFRPHEAREILSKACHALEPGGRLLLEAHTLEQVRSIGREGATWSSAGRGLFSERPHLCLQERFWDENRQVATQRYFIIDVKTSAVTRYAASIQAYTEQEYRTLLEDCGFGDVEFVPSLTGSTTAQDYLVITAMKRQ